MSAGIAWIAATTATIAGPHASSYVLLYRLTLYGVRANGEHVLLASDDYGSIAADGGAWTRTPWFGANVAGATVFGRQGGAALVPVGEHPEWVYHAWNHVWPKPALTGDIVQLVGDADVQCFGDAVLVAGSDYWERPDASCSGNACPLIEAGQSHWVAAREGRVTIRLGE
jgi:hypothetical protein